MSAELVSSLSLSLGSFSTTADGIGGPSYEALLHVVIALASFLGFGMVLHGNELELEAWLNCKTYQVDVIPRNHDEDIDEEVL
ncbi:hypothetical protein Tco_0652365 [Tanacetum coccineum]|uniref:Uncharacterized protein n=1 Tax=Tanacetum coccineum TaxID=301880 RepID=A0ABQ4WXD5_9ASTR